MFFCDREESKMNTSSISFTYKTDEHRLPSRHEDSTSAAISTALRNVTCLKFGCVLHAQLCMCRPVDVRIRTASKCETSNKVWIDCTHILTLVLEQQTTPK